MLLVQRLLNSFAMLNHCTRQYSQGHVLNKLKYIRSGSEPLANKFLSFTLLFHLLQIYTYNDKDKYGFKLVMFYDMQQVLC